MLWTLQILSVKNQLCFLNGVFTIGDKNQKEEIISLNFLVEKSLQTSLFNDLGGAADIDEPVREFPTDSLSKTNLEW